MSLKNELRDDFKIIAQGLLISGLFASNFKENDKKALILLAIGVIILLSQWSFWRYDSE
jgi:hypothetical protein